MSDQEKTTIAAIAASIAADNAKLLATALQTAEELNDVELAATGACHWSATICFGMVTIEWNGIHMWDSDEDDRKEIGTCQRCDGNGSVEPPEMETAEVDVRFDTTCPACGGHGTAEPKEPLRDHLIRQITTFRNEVADAVNAIAGDKDVPWSPVPDHDDLVDMTVNMRVPKAIAKAIIKGDLTSYSMGGAVREKE
jgi:hypothetical protein